mmetsp:Transcript_61814/g.160371  ORF Transcript_61814/g.160371 Transcript_61814/m.160371 type:complete len:239 (-) Transcript_61814:906-1622(-)
MMPMRTAGISSISTMWRKKSVDLANSCGPTDMLESMQTTKSSGRCLPRANSAKTCGSVCSATEEPLPATTAATAAACGSGAGADVGAGGASGSGASGGGGACGGAGSVSGGGGCGAGSRGAASSSVCPPSPQTLSRCSCSEGGGVSDEAAAATAILGSHGARRKLIGPCPRKGCQDQRRSESRTQPGMKMSSPSSPSRQLTSWQATGAKLTFALALLTHRDTSKSALNTSVEACKRSS